MAKPPWRRVRALVEAGLDIPVADRPRWLDEQCAGDSELRAAVADLLQHEAAAESLKPPPVPALAASAVLGETLDLPPGARVGQFELVRRIAEGGMGVVYEARQGSPRRTVALKLMRAGLASAADLSRFRFEAEVLGRLQHPGIAQVYDSGVHVEDGPLGRRETPWFALELVPERRTITEWAAERGLDLEARVQLMLQVCDAVHHGHQKGVVHRDLKPSNLLVGPDGRVKVIDFGVARASEPSFGGRTLATLSGQIVGTIHYMSPEQLGVDPGEVDTRSDVYSLGVVLYELLARRLPFDLDGKPLHEVARIVSLESPRRPRAVEAKIPADLERVVLKAIEKEPAARYASASELASDLRRFLAHEPVQASRSSVVTRARLVVRRNPLATAIGAVALVALVAGAAVYVRNVAAAREAEQRQLYVATIAAASAALRSNNHFDAQGQLDQSPEHLRGWEWRHLAAQLHTHERLLHGGAVGFRGRASIWTYVDRESVVYEVPEDPREPPRRLFESPPGIRMLEWSPDGRRALSAHSDGWVRVFEMAPVPREIAARRMPAGVRCAAFSPDAERIAVAVDDNTVHVFDAALAEALVPPLETPRRPCIVAFVGSHGRRLAVQMEHGFLWLWDPGSGAVQRIATDAYPWIDLSPGAPRIAWCTIGGEAWVHDLGRGETVRVHQDFPAQGSVAVDSEGRWLAATHPDHGLRLLDLQSQDVLPRASSVPGAVGGIAISADGRRVLVGASSGEIRAWDLNRPRGDLVLEAHAGDVGSVAFSPDSTEILSNGTRDRTTRIWSLRAAELARTWTRGGDPLEMDETGRRVIVKEDGVVTIFDRSVDDVIWRMPHNEGEPRVVASFLDRAGETALAIREDGQMERWSIGATEPDAHMVLPLRTTVLPHCDPRIGRIAVVGFGGEVALVDSDRMEVIWLRNPGADVGGPVALAPDGETLAIGVGPHLWLLAARDGSTIRSTVIESPDADSETTGIGDLAFHPDGSRLAVSTHSAFIRLYDVERLEIVATLVGDGSWFGAVAFSPDGRYLAAGTSAGRVFVWDSLAAEAPDAAPLDRSLGVRGRAVFEQRFASSSTIESTIETLRADAGLEPGLREAALRAAYAYLGSPAVQVRRALAVLAANQADASTQRHERAVAAGLARRYGDDPLFVFAFALEPLRLNSLDGAVRAFERVRRMVPDRSDPTWTGATAGLAIALARLGRLDEARSALAAARTGPAVPAEWEPLFAEAERELALAR